MVISNRYIHISIAIIICVSLSLAAPASAKVITFEKEYTYQASELDSKASCRTISLEMVKRLLLEELGTYLISETEVKDFKLTKEQIKTYSAGIVGAEIIEDKWDGKTYWLKAKVSADPKEVSKALKKIMDDPFKGKELEETRKKAEELTKEVERLNKELAKATNKQPSKKVAQEYKTAIQGLTAVEWIERGNEAGNAGRYQEAVNAYTKAIELTPESRASVVYTYRGEAYLSFGDYLKAIGDFDKAIKLHSIKDGHLVRMFKGRGIAYKQMGSYKNALKDLSKVVEIYPDWVSIIDLMAKDPDDFIKRFPNDFRGYILRAVYYGGSQFTQNYQQYEQSINDCNIAIRLNPKYALAYYVRGLTTYYNKASYATVVEKADSNTVSTLLKKALNDLNKAESLNLNPAYPYHFYDVRGEIYSELGDVSHAINDYSKFIEIWEKKNIEFFNASNYSPTLSTLETAYYKRGDEYFKTEKYKEALNDYTRAIKIMEMAIEQMRALKKDDEDWTKSSNYFLSIYYSSRGNVYSRIGLYKEAVNDYNKSIELVPAKDVYLPRGNAHFKLSSFQQALTDYNKAIEIDSSYPEAYYNRGLVHEQLGNYQQALKDFQVAARLGDESAQSYLKSKKIEW